MTKIRSAVVVLVCEVSSLVGDGTCTAKGGSGTTMRMAAKAACKR